jgi:uncharacterized protein (DUF2236 family)
MNWFLGPESVAWKVLTVPWVPLVGGYRTLVIESLHPHAMRGVFEHSDYLSRPFNRLRRTAEYVATTSLGTVEEAERAARIVRTVHRKVHGVDPVTGREYSAGDPDSQVWVHFVQWYSYLVAHRVFVGDLTPDDEDRYCAEGVKVAGLLGTPEDLVPASVAQAREYFARVEPQLCVTPGTRDAIDLVLGRMRPSPRRLVTEPRPALELLATIPPGRTIGAAAVATMPPSLRRLAGLEATRIEDAAAITAMRTLLPVLRSPAGMAIYRRAVGARNVSVGDRARGAVASAPTSLAA